MEDNNIYEREIDLKLMIRYLFCKTKRILLFCLLTAILFTGYKVITSGKKLGETNQITYEFATDYYGMAKIYLGSDSTSIISAAAISYLSGNEVLSNTIQELGLDMKTTDLLKMMDFTGSTDNIIFINVSGINKDAVQNITNHIATFGSTNLQKIFSNTSVTVFEPAYTMLHEYNKEETSLVYSNLRLGIQLLKFFILGIVFGGFTAVSVYFVMFIFDSTIKNEKDVEGFLNLKVLGTISVMKGTRSKVEKGKRRKYRLNQYMSR